MENLQPEMLARAEPIFQVAVGLPSDQQGVFLDEACGGDSALRSVLDRLLANAAETRAFLAQTQTISSSSEATVPPTAFVAGAHIGHYELIRSLGRGGMGQVLLARQENPQRDVALKILRADLSNPSVKLRFRLEAEILGRLNHPGIANIFAQRNTWAVLAPDGESLAAAEFKSNITLYDLFTDRKTVVPTALGLIQEVRWSWDGSRVLCQGALGETYPRWMVLYDTITGTSDLLWHSDGFESIVRPMPSPRGNYLVSQTLTLGVDFFVLEGL